MKIEMGTKIKAKKKKKKGDDVTDSYGAHET